MKDRANQGNLTTSLRAFVLGVILSGLFAWITVMRENFPPVALLSANLIPVLPHFLLVLVGLLINPFLKRVKIARLFSKGELLMIFVMCAVSSGIASQGLMEALVPKIAGLSNPAWNTTQSQWDAHAMPFANENFFMVGEGSQAAAKRLREAHLAYEKARRQYRAARDLQLGKKKLAKLEAKRKTIAAMPKGEERTFQERAMVWPYGQAVKLFEVADKEWAAIGEQLDPQTVVDTFAEKIATLKAERDTLREELTALNQDAAMAAEAFRKGLPPEKRAMPGVFYLKGEGWASYSARFERLKVGREALEILKQAEAAMTDGAVLDPAWAADVKRAADMLEAVSDIPPLSALKETLTAELDKTEKRLDEEKIEGRRLRDLRRYSEQSQFEAFNDRIDELEASNTELKERADALRDQIEKQVEPLLAACEMVQATRQALLELSEEAATATAEDVPVLRERLQEQMATFPSFDGSVRRFWLGDVQWRLWLRPLVSWVLLAFIGYMVLMSFNTLIYRQWAHNEKLIYPLAEIPALLAGRDSDGRTLFRSGLFWTGFAVAAGILGWNHLAANEFIPNIKAIKLQTGWWFLFGNGPLRGLNAFYFCMIFAVVGISFLVPSSISFSLWFFEILFMVLTLVLVWLGHGANRQSFNHVRAGLGSGAMLVFGVVMMWTCRRYLLCLFWPGGLKGLEDDEAKELRVSSALFLGASLALILILSVGFGANIVYTIAFYVISMAIIVTIVRAVAEGGILGLECHTGFTKIITIILGTGKAWCAPILTVPLLMFGGIMGLNKSFIAPTMANALKVRENIRMRRLHFHGAIWAGIIVAVFVSALVLIMIAYQHGAENLLAAKHGGAGEFNNVKTWMTTGIQVKPSEKWWMLSGAVVLTALLLGRRRIFGIPHPIGLLMLMNPNMLGFWGSILIGWMIKNLVSKYCCHEQYVAIRRFFIGLVLGHLAAVLFGWDKLNFHWG